MAVISDAFGGLYLSGEDAKKFRNQTRARHKNAAADKSAQRGLKSARRLVEDGCVEVAI